MLLILPNLFSLSVSIMLHLDWKTLQVFFIFLCMGTYYIVNLFIGKVTGKVIAQTFTSYQSGFGFMRVNTFWDHSFSS